MGNAAPKRPTLGEPFLGPRAVIPIRNLRLDAGLYGRVVEACGGRDRAGVEIGEAVYRHACAHFGPISSEDETLNDFVMTYQGERASRRFVVSMHLVGGIWVTISTSLESGQTSVRPADVRQVFRAERVHVHTAPRGGCGGDR